MKPPKPTPCKACPFRRSSWKGYLGADNAEGFMSTTMSDEAMPCHSTIDYDDPDWKEQIAEGKARHCTGAIVFFANIVKRSRDASRPVLPKDKETVFATPQEFLDHHNTFKFTKKRGPR